MCPGVCEAAGRMDDVRASFFFVMAGFIMDMSRTPTSLKRNFRSWKNNPGIVNFISRRNSIQFEVGTDDANTHYSKLEHYQNYIAQQFTFL